MRNLVKWIYTFMIVAILAAVAFGSCAKKPEAAGVTPEAPAAATAPHP